MSCKGAFFAPFALDGSFHAADSSLANSQIISGQLPDSSIDPKVPQCKNNHRSPESWRFPMIQPLVTDASTVIYPDSDGQPMADNTKQFRWIVVIKENLELLFAERSDVFVAGDLLWYPVEGDNAIRQAPDVMVVFGRPKGDRGSYKQWEEADLAPQVVFEILSPGNRLTAMAKKLQFYRRYGVEEYYVYDPEDNELIGWAYNGKEVDVIDNVSGWISPRLGVRFEVTPQTIEIYRPDGERFLSFIELAKLRQQERQRAEQERQRVEQERQRAEQERQRAESAIEQLNAERQRNVMLEARLREMGIDPDKL
jgi:Uma2 family endonuclease